MKTFIKKVRDNLKIVVKIREQFIENKTAIDNERVNNERLFQIYSVEIPRVLIKMLEELNLTSQLSDISEVDISGVYANFYRFKSIRYISDAYRQMEEYSSVHLLLDHLGLLTKEMQRIADVS